MQPFGDENVWLQPAQNINSVLSPVRKPLPPCCRGTTALHSPAGAEPLDVLSGAKAQVVLAAVLL